MAKNVFKDFHFMNMLVKGEGFGGYSDSVRELMSDLEKYFLEGSWAKKDMDRLFYRHAVEGLSTSVGARLMGLKDETYRGRLARISTKISKELFDGLDLACLLSDEIKVNKALQRVRLYLKPFSLEDELLGGNLLSLLGGVSGDSSKGEDTSVEDKMKALVFIVTLSKELFSLREKQVNRDALAFVLQNLINGGEWCHYFRNMVKVMRALRAPGEAVIDAILGDGVEKS